MTSSFDVAAARAQFPALQQEQIFMDNAGKLESMGVWGFAGRAGYVA